MGGVATLPPAATAVAAGTDAAAAATSEPAALLRLAAAALAAEGPEVERAGKLLVDLVSIAGLAAGLKLVFSGEAPGKVALAGGTDTAGLTCVSERPGDAGLAGSVVEEGAAFTSGVPVAGFSTLAGFSGVTGVEVEGVLRGFRGAAVRCGLTGEKLRG